MNNTNKIRNVAVGMLKSEVGKNVTFMQKLLLYSMKFPSMIMDPAYISPLCYQTNLYTHACTQDHFPTYWSMKQPGSVTMSPH